MSLGQWYNMKIVYKLCHYSAEVKKGQPGYDPTVKYCKVWDVSIYNLNQLLVNGGLDVTIDETTWANGSWA